ncbi:MAG: glycine cleavage system aminomethyltransferase GcvT [Deltaproteobacteria bacterium]|nr:glycine cleavage system aminomethyltransferase GcvT [Deltaproteobacteria bacterium]
MAPKRTPLFDAHVAAGATMVDFAGFEMPVRYSSEREEHLAVRSGVGIFDVSHMGEVFVEGEGALAFVRGLVTNDAAKIVDGQAMYAGLLNERATFIDDVIVYRFSERRFLVCVNASNQDKDFAWIAAQAKEKAPGLKVTNQGADWSQLAVQGPKAVDVVAKLCDEGVRAIGGYHFREGTILGEAGIIARTGYTGEDGFELYVKNAHARKVWDAVLAAGALPCGLACRDTLRLEAGMCLYGNDIDDEHTPLEANLGWIVKLPEPGKERAPFVGMDVLVKQKAAGVQRLLRGLELVDRGIARHGYTVHDEAGASIGVVTSGTQTPFLNKAIAMAYLDRAHAELGHTVFVDVRGKKLKATVVKLPFYRRATTSKA